MRDDITYVVIDTVNHTLTARALEQSQKAFPLSRSLIFSDKEGIWCDKGLVRIPELKSVYDYNQVVFNILPKHLKTSYALMIQYDGYVLNGDLFSEQFLEWDFIGAPWPHHSVHKVGNGGFSLRSKRLIESVQKYLLPSDFNTAEDIVICRYLRSRLEDDLGIMFAPEQIAEMFSYEMRKPDFETFGFHGIFHLPELMQHEMNTLLNAVKPQSVSKFFRAFRDSCEKLPQREKDLFYDFCKKHMSELLFYAKSNAEKQISNQKIF